MRSLHRGALVEISIVFTALLLPQAEAFFFNMQSMSGCCRPMPACCNVQQPTSSSGYGSQLFSSYGVGRVFSSSASRPSYATAPVAGNAYPVPPAPHPWLQHVHQHFQQHAAAAQQHWSAHQAQYQMMTAYSSIPAAQPAAPPTYGYQDSTMPETTTSADEASFFGDHNQLYETSSPAPAPPVFSEQIDEETTMYSTDQTQEPLRGPTPSGYTFTSPPSPFTEPITDAPPIQVESASPRTEVGSYLRSKPPKVIAPPPATQAVDEFSETATWSPPATTAADTRPPQLAFSAAAAVQPAAAPQLQLQQQQQATQPPADLTSTELKELDDLDMLLITSDESFRPVTSANPARPLTTEERAGFSSNDIAKIADGLPPDLSDVIFWPIGKDITLLKRAIALRRRRDEEARKRREGSNPPPQQPYRSEQRQNPRMPTTDERVSSFLAHYFRRRSPGDSRRVSGGEEDVRRPSGRRRSAKSARDLLRSSILEKILAMEQLLAEQ